MSNCYLIGYRPRHTAAYWVPIQVAVRLPAEGMRLDMLTGSCLMHALLHAVPVESLLAVNGLFPVVMDPMAIAAAAGLLG
jgi:hypothetical protein